MKLGRKEFDYGDDVAFQIYNAKDKKYKLYIGTLYSSSENDGTITLSNCEVARESINGLLTVKIDKCKDFNFVAD